MTNTEAVKRAIQIPGYSEEAIEKFLFDAGIDGTVNYIASDKSKINLIAIEALKGMLAVMSITEGGYSISYSVEGIKERLGYLETVEGISGQPKVRAVKLW